MPYGWFLITPKICVFWLRLSHLLVRKIANDLPRNSHPSAILLMVSFLSTVDNHLHLSSPIGSCSYDLGCGPTSRLDRTVYKMTVMKR